MKHVLVFSLLFPGVWSRSSSPEDLRDEDSPVVNLKLVPPKSSFPELRKQIQKLEFDRQGQELAFEADLVEAYNAAFAVAKAKIEKLVQSSLRLPHARTSFLQKNLQRAKHMEDAFQMKVSVAGFSRGVDPAIMATVSAMENKRKGLERELFKQACAEMSALTSLVLSELGQSLAHAGSRSRPVSFLAETAEGLGLTKQANVRIQSSRMAFPRMADLIQEMQLSRDRVESKERQHVLDMELRLLQAENNIIIENLSKIV